MLESTSCIVKTVKEKELSVNLLLFFIIDSVASCALIHAKSDVKQVST